MKTVPFNAEQAKAGRAVSQFADTNHQRLICLVHAEQNMAWIRVGLSHDIVPTTCLSHPAAPAPGHNPAQLDEWTVGVHEGWRLLTVDEIRERQPTNDIECWPVADSCWSKFPSVGNAIFNTYRTRKPPGYFLPKVTTRNLRPDELPDQVLVRRNGGVFLCGNIPWSETGIDGNAKYGSEWSRSLDGPWHPFTVEEKQ